MDASKLAEAMALIKTKRPDLEFFSPNDVIIEWNQRLGEGGFCTAYRAVWRGEEVCARVVDTTRVSCAVEEVATVDGLPDIAVKVHGYTSATRVVIDEDDDKKKDASTKNTPTETGCLAVLTDLCEFGNLEDFMDKEGVPLSASVKLDLMLQVAVGLEQLKESRILWRDLKAKNLLVDQVHRGRTGEVVKLFLKFTDWGTAVKMPRGDEAKRRMTLHGPGTAGYIAPDTRGPTYDYQADMWAFLVWAASMCLKVECVVDCQLEEQIAELKLEKKANATAGHEQKVELLLNKFLADGKVDEECELLFELIKTSAPWVDAALRWTPDEAAEELAQFRADHGLVLEPGTNTAPVRKRSSMSENVKKVPAGVAPAGVTSTGTQDTEVAETVEEEVSDEEVMQTDEEEEATAEDEEVTVSAPACVTALVLVDTAAQARRAAAKELRARATKLKAEAAMLEREAEAACSEDDSEDEFMQEDGKIANGVAGMYDSDDSPMRNSARLDAASASARWVGRRVRKWFADCTGRDVTGQKPPRQKSMLRLKKAQQKEPSGHYSTGVIVKTRAAQLSSRVWTTVCHVRYIDGEEEELTLGEAERFVEAYEEFAGGAGPESNENHGTDVLSLNFTEAIAPTAAVDEDAVTEPVGQGGFCRGQGGGGLRTHNNKNANDSNATSTKATSMAASRFKRPVFGVLSSNETARRAGFPRNAGKPRKFVDAQEIHAVTTAAVSEVPRTADTVMTPSRNDPGSSGHSKRRGRRAPDWAVAAVEVMGVALGCAKCRHGRYGCTSCRARNGIVDPENQPVLALPCSSDYHDTNGCTKKRKATSQSACTQSVTKPKPKKGKTKPLKNLGDISDIADAKELKKLLPRGVTSLGCPKCRQAWRGCGACRKANGVWIAPAQSWVTRVSSSPPGAALMLPAP